MDEKTILISLNASSAMNGEQEDAMQLITTGTLRSTDDGYCIRYDETLDESQPPQHVQLLLGDDGVAMSRTGAYATDMVFRKGKRFESQYITPQGALDLALYCIKASYEVGDEGGNVHLVYQLDMGGAYIAVHDLSIRFAVKSDDE